MTDLSASSAMSARPLVSIVTPVYNGEPYIAECIRSVIAQTYPNWDYTIADNGSSDRTVQIARQYAAQDPRLRIRTHGRTLRVIESYNNACRCASPDAKYVKVLAADDWLFPECLERMVGLAEEHPAVAIVGAYWLRDTDVVSVGIPYTTSVLSGRDACRILLLGGPQLFGTPSAVLYRADIVRSRAAFFDESNFHADVDVCLEFLEDRDFGFVHQILTYRRVQPDCLTAESRRLNTYAPGMLRALAAHGHKYLAEDEQRRRTRACLRDYYRYLGWEVFKGRGPRFWAYHRGQLNALGYELSPFRVAAGAGLNALEVVLNPKLAAGAAARRVFGRGVSRQPLSSTG